MMERHQQLVAEMGIHKVYEDAPAPPLAWPSWLVQPRGGRLSYQRGVDQSGKGYLQADFVTSIPMSEIHMFYKDLLKDHDYPVHSAELGTGHTTTGIQQNAEGHAEGANYPNGHPGPRTEIRVSYSRFYLNEPIKVRIRITAYDFKGNKR